MKILIKVTKEIIEKTEMCGYEPHIRRLSAGERAKHQVTHCQIAEAIREIFPYAKVSIMFITVDGRLPFGGHNLIELPPFATRQIRQFDESIPLSRSLMEPYSFTIDVNPDYFIKNVGLGEVYKILSESKTLELVII